MQPRVLVRWLLEASGLFGARWSVRYTVRLPTKTVPMIFTFGPRQPAAAPEENRVQTTPGKGWFVYLQLYRPELPYFDKTWIPGDAEKMK